MSNLFKNTQRSAIREYAFKFRCLKLKSDKFLYLEG